MITPTVGRTVWFRGRAGYRTEQPQCAFIAFVHGNNACNLQVLDSAGNASAMQDVAHWDGEGNAPAYAHWQWMPYQKGQAAKNDDLEPRVNALEAAIASGYTKP